MHRKQRATSCFVFLSRYIFLPKQHWPSDRRDYINWLCTYISTELIMTWLPCRRDSCTSWTKIGAEYNEHHFSN